MDGGSWLGVGAMLLCHVKMAYMYVYSTVVRDGGASAARLWCDVCHVNAHVDWLMITGHLLLTTGQSLLATARRQQQQGAGRTRQGEEGVVSRGGKSRRLGLILPYLGGRWPDGR